jgi:hypothetical protein
MNGYQKYRFLQRFDEPVRSLISFTSYEMSEGENESIESAFEWAKGMVQEPTAELTDEIRTATLHIAGRMRD